MSVLYNDEDIDLNNNATKTAKTLPATAIANINNFLEEAACVRQIVDFNYNQIYHMDEMIIYFGSNSYEFSHLRKLKSNMGVSKYTRISAAIGASASGQKLPIFMLIPRLTPLKNRDGSLYVPPDNVILRYKAIGTFSQDMMIDYFTYIKENAYVQDGNLINLVVHFYFNLIKIKLNRVTFLFGFS